LAVSYDIVTKHGGRFDLKSEPGKGTALRVYLPVGGPDKKP
jgi:signal transduction histidine kinase